MNGEKTRIRDRIRELRRHLAPEWIAEAGAEAQSLLRDRQEWKAAQRVCSYLALPYEVQTGALVKDCWKSGKQLLVPAFRKEKSRYEPALYAGGALLSGYGGVPEPEEPVWIENGSPARAIDLAVVPGMAFDRRGGRVGHGRGHYDRLLSLNTMRSSFKLGLAFEFQLVDEAPCDAHDVRMDAVVTELNVYMT